MFSSIIKSFYSMLETNKNYKYECIKICLIYSIVGFLWIYFSDSIVNKYTTNNFIIQKISIYKGWLYVIMTTIFLYILISSLIKKVNLTEVKLQESYQNLTASNEELEAYVQQLTASEEELRTQYDQIIESEKKLNISEETNRAIIKALPDLLFIIDDKGYFVDCIANDESLLLMPKETFIGKTLWEVVPKEISKIAYEKMQLVFKLGVRKTFEYKLDINGKESYFEIRMVKNNDREILAISRNITLKRQSEHNFKMIFENSSDAILIVEKDKIIDCNLAMIELLGYTSKSNIIGKSPNEFSPERQPNGELSKDKTMEMYDYTIKNGKYKFEWWYKKLNGTLLPIEVMMTSIFINGKKVFHFLLRDINDRKQMENKLEYLSYHDQLTGLYNRRFFEQALSRLDVESSLPLTVIMADVNGLKLVNDSFGHVQGDNLIKKAAEVMVNGCEKDTVVARLGGDEFIIVLPNTNHKEAECIVENIRFLTSKEKVGAVELSISFGYETKSSKEEEIEDILKKAEDYMYKRKLFESPNMRKKTINAIILALYEKSEIEEQHSHNVSDLCESMGIALELSEDKINELRIVGLLHDIGKIAIGEEILNKSRDLTHEDWKQIKRHSEIGYRILSTVNEMSEMAEYILTHHERCDGSGYPKGLKLKDIPQQARIIAIVDSYDAMVNKRIYREALSEKIAIEQLKINAGSHFDKELTKVFIEKVLNKQWESI